MDYSPPTADQLLRFLEAIPLTTDPGPWLEQFKTSLCELLPDVDRVSIVINFDYDLRDVERGQISLVQQVNGGSRESSVSLPPDSPAEAYEYFGSMGFCVERYQEPITLNYIVKDGDRFASMYLWRRADQPPISVHTILLVLSLRSLTVALFLNLIRARSLETMAKRAFIASLARLVEETDITAKQNLILLHLLEGDSYDQIAEKTGVSIAAVKDTIRRLYRRAGVPSLRELEIKYFRPRL